MHTVDQTHFYEAHRLVKIIAEYFPDAVIVSGDAVYHDDNPTAIIASELVEGHHVSAEYLERIINGAGGKLDYCVPGESLILAYINEIPVVITDAMYYDEVCSNAERLSPALFSEQVDFNAFFSN